MSHSELRSSVSRRGALALLMGGAMLLMGCASTELRAERVPDYALEDAKTYAWITDKMVLIGFGNDQETIRTRENEVLIRAAIDRELASRGLTLVDSSEADLLVAFSVGLRTRYLLEGGPGTAVTMDGEGESQTEGTLNIYLIDRVGEREVWHGWSTRLLSKGEEPQAVIDTAVGKIMAIFPGSA